METLRRPERRRTLRVTLQIPVKVESKRRDGETAVYQAFTQKVSAHGALLMLDAPLTLGDLLVLTNENTSKTVKCFVTHVRDRRDPRQLPQRYVGVGFVFPESNFWRMVFPKAGTRQATRSSRTGVLIYPASHTFQRTGT